MSKGLLRALAVPMAFLFGYFIPGLGSLDFLLKWCLVAMLCITFLGLDVQHLKPNRKHIYLVCLTLLIGFGSWWLLNLLGYPVIAQMAFFTGVAPMASSASIIISFLKGKVEFMVMAFIISNLSIGALMPFMLAEVVGEHQNGILLSVAKDVGQILLIPTFFAYLMRRFYPDSKAWPARLSDFSFGIWAFALVLIAAEASKEIASFGIPWRDILPSALIAAVFCFLSFFVGYFVGRPNLRRECSQALGQKNTVFMIFLALNYCPNPLVVLGPICYVLFHNIWNAYQIRHT